MTTAGVSIDPRLVKLVGRKLYSSNPLPIVVRELLQNSVDACKRKGVEPDIRILIVENDDDDVEGWTVQCYDNGIGMTAEQIVNDFLCLGGKKSSNEGQTGGFGIAKAAIMGCDHWSVQSLDNFLDQETLLKNGDIKKVDRLDGTRIIVRINEPAYVSDLRKAVQMVVLSDVSVHLTVSKDSTWQSWDFASEHAGLNGSIKRKVLHDDQWMTVWGAATIGQELPDAYENVLKPGWNVVRLNGLVQFLYGNPMEVRQNNLFFDVKTTVAPDDDKYPFSMSRETLSEDYRKLVEATVQAHNANVLQSIAVVAREVPPEGETIRVVPGKMLKGARTTSYDKRMSKVDAFGNKTESKFKLHYEPETQARRQSGEPALMLRRYKKDPAKRARHAQILLAWREIMELVATEEFGLGITSDPYEVASRTTLDGKLYYVINPDMAVDEDLEQESPEAIVLALWSLGCHEATHEYVDDHNEWFSTTMSQIQSDTAGAILANLKRIAKRLR